MYKKVIKSMIGLVIIFLIALYIIKLFFPNQFVMIINNDTILYIGNYIDSCLWLQMLIGTVTSYLTFWIYLCAVSRKWYLSWLESIILLLFVVGCQFLYNFDITIANAINLISFIVLPCFVKPKANLYTVAIVFCVHYFAQTLSIAIRNFTGLLETVNSIMILLMTIECYFWLLLFYLYFNLKGDSANG